MSELDKQTADGDMPLMAHFAELRTRFIRMAVAVLVVFYRSCILVAPCMT